MARRPKPRLGEGATCSVLVKFLRPTREVKEKYPHNVPDERVDGLVAVRAGRKTRGRTEYPAVFFTHPEFPGVELSAAQNKIKVVAEGHPSGFWGDAPAPTEPPPDAPVAGNEAIDGDVFFARNNAEDIARIRAEGFEVDDDNDPAPENIPQGDEELRIDGDLFEGQTWGWNGVDRRITEGGNYDGPSFANGWTPTGKTNLEVFLHLFPVAWLTNVVLAMTSSACLANNSKALTWGEFIRFLGMRLLMASSPGWHVDEFWRYETTPRDQEYDPCPYPYNIQLQGLHVEEAILRHQSMLTLHLQCASERVRRQVLAGAGDDPCLE